MHKRNRGNCFCTVAAISTGFRKKSSTVQFRGKDSYEKLFLEDVDVMVLIQRLMVFPKRFPVLSYWRVKNGFFIYIILV